MLALLLVVVVEDAVVGEEVEGDDLNDDDDDDDDDVPLFFFFFVVVFLLLLTCSVCIAATISGWDRSSRGTDDAACKSGGTAANRSGTEIYFRRLAPPTLPPTTRRLPRRFIP